MAGEKAKENKTLTAACTACGAIMSTELLTGLVVGTPPQRRIVAACGACLNRGWAPDEQDADVTETTTTP